MNKSNPSHESDDQGYKADFENADHDNSAGGDNIGSSSDIASTLDETVAIFDEIITEFDRKADSFEEKNVRMLCNIMNLAKKAEENEGFSDGLTREFGKKKRKNASFALFVVNGLHGRSKTKPPRSTLNDLAKEIRGMQLAAVPPDPAEMLQWRTKPETVGKSAVELTGRAKAFAHAEMRQPKDAAALARLKNATQQKRKDFEDYINSKIEFNGDDLSACEIWKDVKDGYALQIVRVEKGSPIIINDAIFDQDKVRDIVLKNLAIKKASKS
ncbi:hypothetical protein [Methylobacterium bullatum]|uniref:Uncharacterized protein n=1 Tax=Methylobacterium bullatum TaxID=570505 RepID=A0AAV4ZD16_9HYPH|nr:hypothetical protein [Methylobacterium bullatum]GJD41958.1 hypothetical protein OICFNHDK_4449 [Methylobacterium bullatum]